jgi:tRNA pseudouridine38-40 synthase
MVRNVRLIIAYDGTDFHGWQRQPQLRTVQGELEIALLRVVRHPLTLHGSGRTDAGVHAQGQVANFLTTCALPLDRLHRAIQSRLPKDVSIERADEVHPEFVASMSAEGKLYRYRIYHSPTRPVERQLQRYTHHCWLDLDLERMRSAARYFIGERDFSAFMNAGTVRESFVRRVIRCDVQRHFEEIRVDVEGSGFLYNQVRIMVGTLIEIGRGHWAPQRLPEILESKDRSQAGPTSPAQGLCLQWVRYPAHLLRAPDRSES